MKALNPFLILCCVLPGFAALLGATTYEGQESNQKTEKAKVKNEEADPQKVIRANLPPAEQKWRTMMDLVFEPAFKNLKKQVGSAAKKDQEVDFRSVRKDALILAEFTARLHQWPDFQEFETKRKKVAYTKEHRELKSHVVYQHAMELYQAATKKQLEPAKKSFAAMTFSCNVCHKKRPKSWSPVTLKP